MIYNNSLDTTALPFQFLGYSCINIIYIGYINEYEMIRDIQDSFVHHLNIFYIEPKVLSSLSNRAH